jgi:galactokinase
MIVNTKNEKAVVGSRLMGGGFVVCTINLIKEHEDRIKSNFRHFI